MIIRALILTASLALGAPAYAGAPAPSGGSGGDDPVELYNALEQAADRAMSLFGPDDTCPRNMDAPAVVVPVVSENGLLTGYAFVVPRVCLKRSGRFDHMPRMHYLTDRFLRAAHRTPFTLSADGELEREATHAAMLQAAGEFIDPGEIDRLDLLGEDLRLLR
ncbi:MAG: hypothetical protein RKE49_09380 [Oceanicaulis sp.]